MTSTSNPVRTILDAMDHPDLFRDWFLPAESWAAWRALLGALFGIPLQGDGLLRFRRATGCKTPVKAGYTECWICAGRRSGKSRILATTAVWLAMQSWEKDLAPGERAMILILAADRRQARQIMNYVKGFVHNCAVLREHYWASETKESLDFQNRVTIEIHTSSFRSVRGYSTIACLCDEIAYWSQEDSSNPDTEVLAALRPSLATMPGSRLMIASSPHAQKGELYRAAQRFEAKDGARSLFWRASTLEMNPTIDADVVAEAHEDDPERAASEWDAQFRKDISSFVERAVIEACVDPGRYDLAPELTWHYYATVDPAGGGGKDSMTVAIAHQDKEKSLTIIDCVREWRPPFDPYQVTAEICGLLSQYRVDAVRGDKWAGDWPSTAFGKCGVKYEKAERTKSEFYLNALPQFMRGAVRLPDNDRLVHQLASLERRTTRLGRDSVDHAPGGNDDLANVVAAAIFPAVKVQERTRVIMDPFGEARCTHDSADTPAQAAQRERRRAAAEGEEYKMPSVYEGIPNPNLFRQ